jgi:N-acetylglucosaminyl-diphospho-decaprenol L-rhamnosyltransferase
MDRDGALRGDSEAAALDVSVAIIGYNTKEFLSASVESIHRSSPSSNFEVIVVDNGSSDGSAEEIHRLELEGLIDKSLVNERNLGYAAAANQGVAASRGRYILILNADTLVRPGALDALVQFMDSNLDSGIAGPKLLYPDGRLQVSTANPMNLWAIFLQQSFLDRAHLCGRYFLLDWDHNSVRDVPQISGAALCVRREVFSEIGAFDEGYFMYCEDTDFLLRASRAGWKITYVPQALVVHYLGQSSSEERHAMIVAYNRSVVRFFRKFSGPGAAFLAKLLTIMGAKIRLIGWAALCLYPPRTRAAWKKTKMFARVWIGTVSGPWGLRSC